MAAEFAQLFGRFEFALKRCGFLINRDVAMADWGAFATSLGSDFFDYVVDASLAPNLLREPPRRLMKDGLTWMPEQPAPLETVEQLFVQGVSRVRNSLLHGEKFVGGWEIAQWERERSTRAGGARCLERG
jgi:hypothetical protein